MRSIIAGLFTALVGVLGGCSGHSGLDTVEVLNDANCRNPPMGLTRIDYGDIARLRGQTLLGISIEPSSDEPELLLLSVYRGPQPTPGYGFALKNSEQHGRTLHLNLTWQQPESGAVLAQLLTTPCLVVGLVVGMERGEIDKIKAFDQQGTLLGTVIL
jgi:hypothetical protein